MKTSLKKFRNLIFCLLMMFDGLLSSQCGVMYLFDRKINKMK